jgi:hypothetical protein
VGDLTAGGGRPAAGGWRLAAGGWRTADGGWRPAAGGKATGGRAAGGGRRVFKPAEWPHFTVCVSVDTLNRRMLV